MYRESIYCGARGNESYVAFCVSRPLDGYGTVPLLNDGSEAFAENRSAEEWESLLFTDSFTRKELQMFESKIASLESPLDGKKEPAAYTEIRNFAERMCRQNFDSQFEAAQTNQKFGIILQTAYETTATFACHGILFASLCQRHASNEKALQIRLHDMRSQVIEKQCPVDRAGLTKEFLERFDLRHSDIFIKATERLQQLNESKSPLEKLWCVQEANRALREIPGNDNMDDSLPLFLLCLVNAAPGLLLANLAFMSDFAPRQWVKNAGELAFHCTVFSGAILLIQEHVPQVVDDGDRSLLRNLIVAGGSGLSAGGGWSSSNSGLNNSKLSSNVDGSFSPLKWFEGCAPQFRT